MVKTVTKVYLQCEKCNEAILNPEDGFLVMGNIYVAQSEPTNGLIGSAFPNPDKNGNISADAINQVAYCKSCFRSALKMGNPGRPKQTKRNPNAYQDNKRR